VRDSLAFAPATASIGSSQSSDFTDGGPCGERLDLRNVAQNLEVHRPIVSKLCDIVNVAAAAAALRATAQSRRDVALTGVGGNPIVSRNHAFSGHLLRVENSHRSVNLRSQA
jgi:hypothetical protein